MSEMREGTPEWALAYMEDAARITLLDEGSGTKELRKAVKIITTALAEAEARGRRQGLEEAAKLTDQRAEAVGEAYGLHSSRVNECSRLAGAIRSLAIAPVKTGESNHA